MAGLLVNGDKILVMIKNYIQLAIRHFGRNRGFFLINILGLTIGISACVLIFLVIEFELSFDKFHRDYANIYRVVGHDRKSSGEDAGSLTPYPFIKAFRNDFPEVPLATQLHYEEEVFLRRDDDKVKVEHAIFADSLFFEVFDFEVVSGNPKVDLGQPGKAFITESLAGTLGIERSSLPVRASVSNTIDIEIVGILRDPPPYSHIQFRLVVSMPSLTPVFVGGFPLDQWTMTSSGYTYIRLPETIAEAEIEDRLVGFVRKYFKKEDSERRSFLLQPLNEIHFSPVYTENPGPARNASYNEIGVMALLALFMLTIACINFINLSTAMGTRKSREVGIRKTLGARRSHLAGYFLAETFIIIMMAVVMSLGIAEWVTPWLSGFIGKQIQLNLFSNYTLLIFLAALVVVTTLLAGCYPALVLSGYNPAAALRGKNTSAGGDATAVRRILVVCQFLIAQLLIIGTLVISDQMDYFINKPLGFDKDAVLVVPLPENDKAKLESLKQRLLRHPSVISVSFSLGAPTSNNNFGSSIFRTDGTEQIFDTHVKPVDIDYLETYGLSMKAGRWFTESEEKMTDRSLPEEERRYVYLLNESAARTLGFTNVEDVVGEQITTGVNRIKAEVVGVVSDFHVASLHNEIGPVVMLNLPEFYYEGGIKVSGGDLDGVIDYVKQEWESAYADYYFEYSFLDDSLERLYRQDQRTLMLMRIFSGVSIFVACLGLYGLVSFMASQRLKEVGIRKVMGASVSSILMLFSTGFLKLILISFAMAVPVAWLMMNHWLENFPYHVTMHWSVYAISLLATIIVSVATISYRSYRAACANPADTLRSE